MLFVVVLVSTMVDSIYLQFPGKFLIYIFCPFIIISFCRYIVVCCISALAKVDMDCIHPCGRILYPVAREKPSVSNILLYLYRFII